MNNAFTPIANTVLLAAAGVAPTGVKPLTRSGYNDGHCSFRFVHTGNQIAYIGYGSTAAEAQSNSVAPTGTSRKCIPLAAGSIEILDFPDDTYFSAITSADCSIFITAGEGL